VDETEEFGTQFNPLEARIFLIPFGITIFLPRIYPGLPDFVERLLVVIVTIKL